MIAFLHPWVLLGLPVAAIPLVLHLIQRRDPPTLEFPAVRYLVQVTQEYQRHLRLRHLLLLLVRTLMILGLVLAAAGPTAPVRRAASHAPSALVVVLDDSPSSGAVVAGTTRLTDLRAAAKRILERSNPTDALWLLASDGVARRGGAGDLVRAVDSLSPSVRRMDLGQAVTLAGEILSTDHRPGGIVVLTDLQATALSPATPSVPVVVARPSAAPPLNTGIVAIDPGPAPWTTEGGTIAVTVAGDSGAPAPVSASLGDRAGRQALVPSGGTVTLALGGVPPGWWTVRASKAPDELRADDERLQLVRIAAVSRASWDAADRYLGAAADVLLASGRLSRGSDLTLGRLGPGPSVVVPPSDPAALGALNRALERRAAGWRFGIMVNTPAVSDSTALVGRTQVFKRYTLEPLVPGAPRGVIATANGAPWIVRGQDVVLIGSRMEPDWTSLPLAAGFMPFMDAVVNRLARGELALLNGSPGDAVPVPDLATEVARQDRRWRVEGGAAFHPPAPGIYFVLAGRDTIGGISVNLDPRESALRPASDVAVSGLWRGVRVVDLDAAAGAAFAGRGQASLQSPLLWLVLALGLVEVALASGLRRSA